MKKLNKKFNAMSLFNGMGFARMALKELNIKVNKFYSSEIDKYANQAQQALFPDVIQIGDVTKWREWDIDWPSVGLLMGGSPCQGFSFAGKQAGTKAILDDVEYIVTTREMYLEFKEKGAKFLSQSHLFWEYILCLDHVKLANPNVKFLLENVKMKKELLGMITEAIQVEPVCINSSLVSAQNRVRYYWTNIAGVEQPKDTGVTWGDIREYGVNEFYYTEKGLQWLARHSQRKNKTLDVWSDDEKAQMVEASHFKNYSSQRFFGVCDLPEDQKCIGAMRGCYLVDGKRNDKEQSKKGNTAQFVEFRHDKKSNALTTVQKDNIVIPFTLPNRIPVDMFFFRYITPRECFRLQTVPEYYIDILLSSGVSNTQLYKMCGNGWTHKVIVHILKGLL